MHTGKDLAVSPELNRFVTVRTYALLHAGVTRYHSHPTFVRFVVFGLSSLALRQSNYPAQTCANRNTKSLESKLSAVTIF